MIAKAVSFVAKSGTGKTTLLEKVIAELKLRGYRVGVIKHDAHRFDIDHPGKDSHRLTAAGADTMLISSPEKLAVVKQHAESPPIEELIATYFGDVDLILTEGFKKSGLPKIEVHRKERSATLLCRGEQHDPSLLAVASDEPLEMDVPVLDLNNPALVADFVEKTIIHGKGNKMATVEAVCISENKGERKKPVESVELRENHGIVGDGHAGEWHRQVSLLATESIEKMRKLGLDVTAGDFAENITTKGIDLVSQPIGTHLQVGEALLEVTQIGKECHTRCAIYYQAGDCVMPKEGIFARVISGGVVKPGDEVKTIT